MWLFYDRKGKGEGGWLSLLVADHQCLTYKSESQLSADYLGIRCTPKIITYCAPDIVDADLYSSLSAGASLKSDGSSSASEPSTPHSSIFTVYTVMAPQWTSRTIYESGLSSTTLDIIQPDLTDTISETRGQRYSSWNNRGENSHRLQCLRIDNILVLGSPRCTQATLASTVLQKSSNTVPQTLLLQISTRPWVLVPPWSLMAPWVQLAHLTPASSLCTQLWLPSGLARQSMSLVSVPRQWTLSSQIWAMPLVKPEVRAVAPESW